MTLLALAIDNEGTFNIVQDHYTKGSTYDAGNKTADAGVDTTHIKVGLAGVDIASVDSLDIYKRFVQFVDFAAIEANVDDVTFISAGFDKAFEKFAKLQGERDEDITVMFAVVHFGSYNCVKPAWQRGYTYNKQGLVKGTSNTQHATFRYAWGAEPYIRQRRTYSDYDVTSVQHWRRLVRHYHRVNSGCILDAINV